ncbi:hypothetical protein MUN88_12200 [Gracilibacillus caseinilyticus]|uniref:CN hydrolase domain-containing protein n=1 Tax=Gracilibacillus caseinilyticus TaxID=2932256 RepID=A0ABY4ER04_9BACI|nr:hypothetical protein [Gracilibacillus caseinilyticus]UOQ46854.1 hypothetical protein MUN88_12200 [Gracilibacillus caseinilyticus]
MKLLIMQPNLEKQIAQLEAELKNNPDVDAVIFPEGYLNENVGKACELASKYNTVLIGGHRRLQESPKDRILIINRFGELILDRVKYSKPCLVMMEELKVGHILCDELIVQAINDEDHSKADLIVHPIGVGMFSEEQFQQWITEATKIAIKYKTMIIGTSHADGSYGDTGISIPIAYCMDETGEVVFIAKNDVRTRLLNAETKEVSVLHR